MIGVTGIVSPGRDPSQSAGFWPASRPGDIWLRPRPPDEIARTWIAAEGGWLLRMADAEPPVATIACEQNPQARSVTGHGFTRGG